MRWSQQRWKAWITVGSWSKHLMQQNVVATEKIMMMDGLWSRAVAHLGLCGAPQPRSEVQQCISLVNETYKGTCHSVRVAKSRCARVDFTENNLSCLL
jgi:hypothetical protein